MYSHGDDEGFTLNPKIIARLTPGCIIGYDPIDNGNSTYYDTWL